MDRAAPSLRRYLRWRASVLPRLVYAISALSMSFEALRRGWVGRWLGAALLLMALAALVAILVHHFRFRSRVRAYARAVDGRACPECGYSLVALDNLSACPECGTAIDLATVPRLWHNVV